MRVFLGSLLLLSIISIHAVASHVTSTDHSATVLGRWRVKFTLLGGTEKNLVFEARPKGAGSFVLLDTGPDDKPVPGEQTAAWSLTTNNLSVSSEVELPIGTCCRETGTLILKAKFNSGDSFAGKLVFVTNIEEDESPYKYHSTVGTFTATRVRD